MPDAPKRRPLHSEEVRAWDLTQAIVRTVAGTCHAASRQSRLWQGSWIAAILVVTSLFVASQAPLIAYAVPLGSLVIISHSGLEARR
jgi:hypothetical protein